MADQDKIKAALAGLDPANADIWTSSGLPLVDVIRKMLNDDTITREQITNADPTFTREVLQAQASKQVKAVQDPVETTGDGATDDVQAVIAARQEKHDEVVEEIAIAEQELHELRQASQDAQRKLEQVMHKRDELIRKQEKLKVPAHVENTLSIQKYIATANAERMARAGVASELRKHGITPLLLQPGSKLDQAMARKRGFGLARPVVRPTN